MALDMSAEHVPPGDIAAAITHIDSFLRRVYDNEARSGSGPDPADVATTEDQFRILYNRRLAGSIAQLAGKR